MSYSKSRNLTNYIQRIYSNKDEMNRESKLIDAKLKSFHSVLSFFPSFSIVFSLFFIFYFDSFFSPSFYVCLGFFLCFKLFGWYVLLLICGFFSFSFFFHVGCVTWYHRISKRFITYYSNLARLNNICSHVEGENLKLMKKLYFLHIIS